MTSTYSSCNDAQLMALSYFVPVIQQVIDENNVGVFLVESGDCTAAIQSFQRGLRKMNESNCSTRYMSNEVHHHHEYAPVCFVHPAVSAISAYPHTMDLNKETTQADLCFVYDHPLLLHTENRPGHQTVVAVLLFNFALACQRHGKQTGKHEHLRLSCELYDLLLRIHGQDTSNSEIPDYEAYALLKCLALNNLGHIYHEGCEYRESQYYMECLYDQIMSTGCLETPLASSFLTTYESEEIQLNLMYLKPPSTAKAA